MNIDKAGRDGSDGLAQAIEMHSPLAGIHLDESQHQRLGKAVAKAVSKGRSSTKKLCPFLH